MRDRASFLNPPDYFPFSPSQITIAGVEMTKHATSNAAVLRSTVAKVILEFQRIHTVPDDTIQPDQDRSQVAIYGYPLGSSAPKLFDVFFPSMGLPRFRYTSRDTKEVETAESAWRYDILQPWCLGTVVTMPLKVIH